MTTPGFIARLSPPRARALAVALLMLAILLMLTLAVAPALVLHRHYDDAIEATADRLIRYRRVAAQAPELANALEAVRERNGRRFFLRNTAPNLASAELSELVKGAIEAHGGRITTSQNVAPKDDDRFRLTGANVQFFATTANLQRVLAALETQQPYVVVANITVRPVNAFRGFKPPPGQEPELIVQLDAVAWSYPEVARTAASRSASPQPPRASVANPGSPPLAAPPPAAAPAPGAAPAARG